MVSRSLKPKPKSIPLSLSVSRLAVQTPTSEFYVCVPLTQIVMQEEHKRFIPVQAKNALSLVWGMDLYYPAPRVLIVGVYELVAIEEMCPKSRLEVSCMWWTVSWCLSVCDLARVCVSACVSMWDLASPFIVSRGGWRYMCLCYGVMVLIRGMVWSMASYGDGEASHSLCRSQLCCHMGVVVPVLSVASHTDTVDKMFVPVSAMLTPIPHPVLTSKASLLCSIL